MHGWETDVKLNFMMKIMILFIWLQLHAAFSFLGFFH